MKVFFLKIFTIISSYSCLLSNEIPQTSNISFTVSVDNIRNTKGTIKICLFSEREGFPIYTEKAISCRSVRIKESSITYTFADIKPGSYAVCAFHDENNDKKINTNLIGMPKEGIGVSNNAKGHFGPPKFEDAKLNISGDNTIINIQLSYL